MRLESLLLRCSRGGVTAGLCSVVVHGSSSISRYQRVSYSLIDHFRNLNHCSSSCQLQGTGLVSLPVNHTHSGRRRRRRVGAGQVSMSYHSATRARAGADDDGGDSKRRRKMMYYAVVKGREPGLYRSWESCVRQVHGFSGNVYKGFADEDDAKIYLRSQGVAVVSSSSSASLDRDAGDAIDPATADTVDNNHDTASNAVVNVVCARVEFDGASKKNPGPSGFGAVIFDDDTGSVLKEVTGYLGDEGTNNQAEYAGLVAGLYACKEMGIRKVKVRGDSKLVIHQILNKWQVKNDVLKLYHDVAMGLIRGFESFEAEHVLREFNTHADRLSNVAVEEKKMWSLNDDVHV